MAATRNEEEEEIPSSQNTPQNTNTAPRPLTVQTQLSFTYILSNGLVFFTALTVRDYLNQSFQPVLPGNQPLQRFLKLILTLVIVAAALVAIEHWKKKL